MSLGAIRPLRDFAVCTPTVSNAVSSVLYIGKLVVSKTDNAIHYW